VVEDVLVPSLVVTAVPPPVVEELAGRGEHRRYEDEQLCWEARAHEWRREAAERMPDDNKFAAVTDRPDDGVGVLRPTCRLVLAREVDRDGIVSALAAEARRRERNETSKALHEPWPLKAWPDTPTRYLLCRDDRMFSAAWARRHAHERLGIEADDIDGGHYISLSRPRQLAQHLHAYAAAMQ
jgi:hypothetical protein